MERTGIPASIKLAQAILESGGGTSELARVANNHFGMKCTDDWGGGTYNRVDDEKDAFGNPKHSCFKQFSDAITSFRQHSELLLDPRRNYLSLFDLSSTDYTGWAQGLQKAGYASDPLYTLKLIGIIEKYKLYEYDRVATTPEKVDEMTANSSEAKPEPEIIPTATSSLPLQKENEVKQHENENNTLSDNTLFVHAQLNETMEDIARRTHKKVHELLFYNDFNQGGDHPLPAGMLVYIRNPKYYSLEVPEEIEADETDSQEMPEIQTSEAPTAKDDKKALIPDLELVFENIRQQAPQKPIAYQATDKAPKKSALRTEKVVTSQKRTSLPEQTAMATAASVTFKSHTIVKSDTLWSLSQHYGTTVAHLKKINRLSSNLIREGDRLLIP